MGTGPAAKASLRPDAALPPPPAQPSFIDKCPELLGRHPQSLLFRRMKRAASEATRKTTVRMASMASTASVGLIQPEPRRMTRCTYWPAETAAAAPANGGHGTPGAKLPTGVSDGNCHPPDKLRSVRLCGRGRAVTPDGPGPDCQHPHMAASGVAAAAAGPCRVAASAGGNDRVDCRGAEQPLGHARRQPAVPGAIGGPEPARSLGPYATYKGGTRLAGNHPVRCGCPPQQEGTPDMPTLNEAVVRGRRTEGRLQEHCSSGDPPNAAGVSGARSGLWQDLAGRRSVSYQGLGSVKRPAGSVNHRRSGR
jgi:hypothetical protein